MGEVCALFLRLGTTAFGGPAAHIAMMEEEVVVRRGWFRDEPVRRQYDRPKGEMHDGELERVWTNLHGELSEWVAPAITANVRARLLKMIVE